MGLRTARLPAALATVTFAGLVAGCASGEGPTDPSEGVLEPGEGGTIMDASGTRVQVRVQSMKLGGDEVGTWIAARVRVDNGGSEDSSVPDLALVCSSGGEEGGWHGGSSLEPGSRVAAGGTVRGVVRLLAPGDGRDGRAVHACAGTVTLQVTPASHAGDEQLMLTYAVAPALVAKVYGARSSP